MMRTRILLVCAAVTWAGSVSWVAAQQKSSVPQPAVTEASASQPAPAAGNKSNPKAVGSKPAAPVRNEPAAERIEGEKRFRANCGRCHQSPHRFPPREMATIIRHMRVRATITDEDMRLILKYMTQ